MNKLQLEEIKKKINEIRRLISEDINGVQELKEDFNKFSFEVDNELKNIIWREYLRMKLGEI
jgi:archaellum component FlaC